MRMEGFGLEWSGILGSEVLARFGTTWHSESAVSICVLELIASGIGFLLENIRLALN